MTPLPAPRLSDARRAALHAYVADLRAFLLLGHWRIDIPDEWPHEGHDVLAAVDPCEGRHVATVRLGPAFWDLTPVEQRDTLVHELLHLHHVRITDTIRSGPWRHSVGQGLYDQVYDTVRREAEYMVDALTSIVAPLAPRPPDPWPDGRDG